MATTYKRLPVALRRALTEPDYGGKTDGVKLTLKELVKATDVSERTIRYYIQEGVLPPPSGSGPASRYGVEHLTRLSLVRRFKAALLPLNQIKQLFDELLPEELEQVADQFHHELTTTHPVLDAQNQTGAVSVAGYPTSGIANQRPAVDKPLEIFRPPDANLAESTGDLPTVQERWTQPKPTDLEVLSLAGRWDRITLAPGLEIHYEAGGPQDTEEGRKRLAQLVELAMQLYR